MSFSRSVDKHWQVYNDEHSTLNQFITEAGTHVLLVCNNQNNEMLVFERENHEKYNRITKFDYLKENRVLIGENGARWEGNANRNNKPCGYGKMYDDVGALVYEGFMYEDKKVCYGTEYFHDVYSIDYCGCFLNDKRHGFGKSFDRNKNLLYEGEWMDGHVQARKLVKLADGCENFDVIHDRIEKLIIGDHCMSFPKAFVIENNNVLKKLYIGQYSFGKVENFKMVGCTRLEEVVFGKYSFFDYVKANNKMDSQNGWYYLFKNWKRNGTFSMCDCEKLKRIVFKGYSFADYGNTFSLESTILFPLFLITRSSVIRRSDCERE